MFKSKKYAWVICALGLLSMFCSMGIASNMMSFFLPYIEQTGISHSAGSALISVRALFSLLTLLLINWYYKKTDLRKGLFIAMATIALSAFLYSISKSVVMYVIATAFGGVGFALGGAVPVSVMVKRWFKDRLGIALALATLGSSIASVTLPPMLEVLVQEIGLSGTYLSVAAFSGLSALLMILFVRDNPEDIGLEAYSEPGNRKIKELNFKESNMSNASLWMMLVVMFLVGSFAQSSVAHLGVLAETCNYPGAVGAMLISLFGLASGISKLVFGTLADYFSTKRASQIMFVICMVGFVFTLLMDGQAIWPCVVFGLFLGFGLSVSTVGTSLWAVDLSDASSYEKNLKFFQIVNSIGGIIFGFIPGIVYDQIGDYRPVYIGFIFLALVAMILLTVTYRRELGS